jgi:heme oxygenase
MTNSEYLRGSTRDEHSDTEATVDLLSLVEHPDLYVPLLKAFASYYRTIELKLSPFERELETLGLNLKDRFKLPLLTKDLAHFSERLDQLPHAKFKAFEYHMIDHLKLKTTHCLHKSMQGR